MNESQLFLQKAIEDKARIKVIYHGGSMAGKLREISPISIIDGKLRAKCHVDNAFKTFLVDKMQVMEQSTGELSEEKIRDKVRPQFKSLDELYQYCIDTIDSSIFSIKKNNDSLTIYSCFKNGKLKKSCDVGIYYEEIGTRFLDEFFIESENFVKERPWVVSGKKINSISFKYFDKATNKFTDYIDDLLS